MGSSAGVAAASSDVVMVTPLPAATLNGDSCWGQPWGGAGGWVVVKRGGAGFMQDQL